MPSRPDWRIDKKKEEAKPKEETAQTADAEAEKLDAPVDETSKSDEMENGGAGSTGRAGTGCLSTGFPLNHEWPIGLFPARSGPSSEGPEPEASPMVKTRPCHGTLPTM